MLSGFRGTVFSTNLFVIAASFTVAYFFSAFSFRLSSSLAAVS